MGVPTGPLHLGAFTGGDHERTDEAVHVDPSDLTTHGVIVGMTGSGKTGLGLVLLEEALASGIPVLALDPKGDLGNLLLTFPEPTAEAFGPWVPDGTDPATTARDWAEGLASWGVGAEQLAKVAATPKTVYTPGSGAGVPLNLIGSLQPPTNTDAEDLRDEAEAIVSGLLGLVGVTSDPLAGREHVLLANLLERAWAEGVPLDLPTLVLQVQDPPMRTLGVIELESFYPRSARSDLVMRLNALVASPSFTAWGAGEPLDVARMLWTPEGAARAAIVYLAHLSDAERQLVVSRILTRLVSWMRRQPGTPGLRVLVYLDEAFGFVPPTAAPPSKKPILTLFKQARAHGVGVVLATQNPVDLDYKAISNAGTWMVGRLQTQQDKARLTEGLTLADGTVAAGSLDATISHLAKREFLLHRVGRGTPRTFTVRWAMSYLRGPLSRDELAALPGMDLQRRPLEARATPTTPAPDDTLSTPPKTAPNLVVRYLDPAAPWAAEVGAVPGGARLVPAIALRCTLRYDDTALGLDQTDTWEAVLVDPSEPVSFDDHLAVDYDDRDLLTEPPPGARYEVPRLDLTRSSTVTALPRMARDWLVAHRRAQVRVNRTLKLSQRPGEDDGSFEARCRTAADTVADARADAIRRRLEPRIDRLRAMLEDDQLRARQLGEEAAASRQRELLTGAGDLLGALLGGRRSTRSISGALSRSSAGRARSQRVEGRLEQTLARVDRREADLAELEAQLAAELLDLHDEAERQAGDIEVAEVPLEKADVTVEEVALVWIPRA
jgi:hypothetical protein